MMKLFKWQWFFPLHLYQTNVAAAVIGGAVVGAAASSYSSKKASDAQSQSAQQGISETQRQFDAVQSLLKPYVNAGTSALTGQQDLLGLNGAGAQSSAIQALQNSPQYAALSQSGQNAILQNASATGGIRGGNVQGALAQYQPALLSSLINQQYANLGGLTSVGQNAAAMTGNAGMQTASSVSSLLQQQGAAQAGGILANGQAIGGAVGNLAGLGAYYGQQGQANYSPSYSPAVYGDGGLYASGGANSGQF